MASKQKKTGTLEKGKENMQNAGELSLRFLSPTRSVTTSSANRKTPGSTMSASRYSQSKIAAMKMRTKRKSEVRRGSFVGNAQVTTPVETAKRQKNDEQKITTTPPQRKSLPKKIFCEDQEGEFTLVIWPILAKLGFTHSAGRYRHPDIEVFSSTEISASRAFDSLPDLRKYLCSNGIPNFLSLESSEEREEVETWVKFAHVPFNDCSSDGLGSSGLSSRDVLPDKVVQQKILPAFGFEFISDCSLHGKPIFLAPGASDLPIDSRKKGIHYFFSLEEVRVYVRSHEIQAVVSPIKASIRNRKDETFKEECSQERLWLHLWGATSKQHLPVFRKTRDVPSLSPSSSRWKITAREDIDPVPRYSSKIYQEQPKATAKSLFSETVTTVETERRAQCLFQSRLRLLQLRCKMSPQTLCRMRMFARIMAVVMIR